jgi:hypothetical protein
LLISSYPEHQKLRKENRSTISAFIFEEILCRWGALEEIVTDNSLAFVEALNWLVEQYRIHHIHISPYNSQVNRTVKSHHLDVREATMKVRNGEKRKWPTATHAAFWAEQITTHKALGHSAYYIVHGVKPLLLFDLAEATYMVLPQSAMMTTELVVLQAQQLQKRPKDLDIIWDQVMKACSHPSTSSRRNMLTRFALASQFVPGDNLNTTQTPECTKDKNAKIKSERVSPKVPPTICIG